MRARVFDCCWEGRKFGKAKKKIMVLVKCSNIVNMSCLLVEVIFNFFNI